MLLVGKSVCGSTCAEVCPGKISVSAFVAATPLNAMVQMLSCWYCKKKRQPLRAGVVDDA